MNFDLETVILDIFSGCMVAFRCFLLIILPFSELIRRMQAQGKRNAKIAARLDIFERNMIALLSNKAKASADSTTTDTKNRNAKEGSVSATDGSSIASTLQQSSSVSPPINEASSTSKQASPNSLMQNVKALQMQSNETALGISDKIDELQEANQTLKVQIATLEGQLQEQRCTTNKIHNRVANRLDMLEDYIQNSTKFEYQRIQESQQVQALSQTNTDLINQRIDALEEQLITSFEAFEETRSKELQSFVGTSRSLSKLCDDIKMKLDKQAQMAAEHDKEIAKNTKTIRNTFSSEALAGLEQGVREALNMCESKLVEFEKDNVKMKTLVEGTSDKLKLANGTLKDMQTKFHALKEDISVEIADASRRQGWISERVFKTAKRLGFEFDLMYPQANVKTSQQTKGDETKTHWPSIN